MIVVTAASHAESMWIPRLRDVRRLVTGVGRSAGEALTRSLSGRGRTSAVVGTGFCGGLAKGMPAGTVIIGDEIDFDGERIAVDRSLVSEARSAIAAAQLPFRVGRIATTNRVIRSLEEKEELARRGAIAVDMESGVLCLAARAAEVPFLPLRVVLDARERSLPFTGDRGDVLRAIAHPISTLRLMRCLVIAGRAIGNAVAAIAAALVARRGECAA
jgi:nucleoside phosphorylase